MKQIKYYSLLIAGLFFLASFTLVDGTETRTLGDFDQLDVSSGVTVILVKSNTTKVEIETEGVEPSEVVTEINGSELKIKYKKQSSWGKKKKATVTVYYKNLNTVEASSGSTVKSDEVLKGDELEIDVSSGASCQLEVDCGDLEVDISSGATVRLSGTCRSQNVDVSSGASYAAEGLNSTSANVEASSGASARIWVSESLEASANSGGSVRYKGDPKNTKLDKSYSGSVKKA